MKKLRLRLQDQLWYKLVPHLPRGRVARVLFCWPCEPIHDHCGHPEHDYCARCGRVMPGEAPRPAVKASTTAQEDE